MTSDEQTITYLAIRKRAKDCALEYMPSLPEKNTYENWESFQQDVEALDSYDIAYESSDWDWVIYYHRALELCQAVPSGILHEAESEVYDNGGIDHLQGYGCNRCSDKFGLYEMAALIASQIVIREIAEAVEDAKEELIDLAETQMESF